LTRSRAIPPIQRRSAAYDSGDHLHPNDASYQAMANSIKLSLFSLANIAWPAVQ
jgi:lysophospholipase L1-like esterase